MLVQGHYLRGNVTTDAKKLEPLWQGPWKIIKCVRPNLYEVDLPKEYKVRREINIVNLKKWYGKEDRTVGSVPDIIEGKEEYEVERILKSRKARGRGGKKQYLVRWLGYGEEHDSWIHKDNLGNA